MRFSGTGHGSPRFGGVLGGALQTEGAVARPATAYLLFTSTNLHDASSYSIRHYATQRANCQPLTAYIVDSGIRFDHTEFEGRAVRGYDAMNDGQNASDCHGHGTHVAGTVGGRTWGVAKSVKLVSVRVLGCDGGGTVSGLIAGIDWVAKNHVKPAVANISIGAGQSSDLNSALRNMINAGIQSSVSAGNSDADACNQSPASTAEAITVGATLPSDARRTSSNWGSCVDLFAPGSSITSASHADSTGSTLKSGTSMAAPHVAGVAALLLQESSGLPPQELRDRIWEMSTKNIVTDAKSQNAHLLYSLSGAAPPSKPAPTAPSAPGSLAAKEMTSSRVDLSWADQSSNEDGFRIERKTGTGSWGTLTQVGADATLYSDASVQKDVTYSYRVIAFTAAGSVSSNEVTSKVACKTRPKTTTCQ
jgi:subtilisin family serine protease